MTNSNEKVPVAKPSFYVRKTLVGTYTFTSESDPDAVPLYTSTPSDEVEKLREENARLTQALRSANAEISRQHVEHIAYVERTSPSKGDI